jgi:hypothetical protein
MAVRLSSIFLTIVIVSQLLMMIAFLCMSCVELFVVQMLEKYRRQPTMISIKYWLDRISIESLTRTVTVIFKVMR